MKKITLSAIIIMTSIISLQAQLYTPPGTVLGNSLNSNIGIGTDTPLEKLSISGHHADTRFLIHSEGGREDKLQADLMLWASEPGLTYTGVGIGNNIHNYKTNAGNLNLLNPTRGGSYIRLLDNAMSFNVVSASGTDKQALNIDSNGSIGIGTVIPSFYQHGGNNKVVEIFNPNTTFNSQSHVILSSGSTLPNSSIGSITWATPNTTSPNKGLAYLSVISGSNSTLENPSSSMIFTTRNATQNNWNPGMILNEIGNLGIGTQNPDSKLTVAGNIHAQEVKVTVNAGADFVFENDYNLPSLATVETFIKENKHLPEIASAKEMKKNGINLSEMNIKLLQKVEELTLYSIEQNKKILIIEKQNKKLEIENQAFRTLSERLSRLENQLK